MNPQKKLNEFKEALKEAILNQTIPVKIEPEICSGYNGCISVELEGCKLRFSVANTFVCYFNNITEGMFSDKDIVKLNAIIKEKLDKNKEKADKIRTLQNELNKLRIEFQEI